LANYVVKRSGRRGATSRSFRPRTSPIFFCARCERLYRAGDDEALVTFAVLRQADLGATTYDDFLPIGTLELRQAGFVPVSELTGDDSIVDAWPAEHRRCVPVTDQAAGAPTDNQFWLIRSPWPSLSMTDVFAVIWGYVEPRAPIVNHRINPNQHRAAIAEFAGLDENQVVALIAAQRPGDEPE
jgi:hypothetical protein